MLWNCSRSFHACNGSLATSADRPAMAAGCHTSICRWPSRPAALKYAAQSSPGAFVAKSPAPQVVGLVHVLAVEQAFLRPGDLRFHRHDGLRPGVAVADAGLLQQC